MNDETGFRSPIKRSSFGSFNGEFNRNENADNVIEDPISAYFKQRCGDASKSFFKKQVESDSDSSVGLIDVENVSLFGDREDGNFRLTGNSAESESNNSSEREKYCGFKTLMNEKESQLMKQRALAQKALLKLNAKINETENTGLLTPEKSRESNALIDISSKFNNEKSSVGNDLYKNWFQPNYSPDTPRYFNDELSSLGGEDGFPFKDDTQAKQPSQAKQSQYTKQLNSMLKDFSQFHLNPDIEFKSCTKEEQINKLEEDEKKFKLENSGVLHNSGISQFSGVAGEEIASWAHESEEPEQDIQKLSIGQFFNMRSNRVSSLLGSTGDEKSLVYREQDSKSSTLIEFDAQKILRNEYSLPICDSSNQKKEKLRRCASSCDLVPKSGRRPNDSCSSNTTLIIQNLLAEMESGLSGTQIYEKLMKSYGKKKESDKLKETPKSSKGSKGKGREISKAMGRQETEVENVVVDNESRRPSRHTPSPDVECKENKPENLKTKRNEKIKKVKSRKGFDASTPKIQVTLSQNEKFRSGCSKAFLRKEDWKAPRVSSIRLTMDVDKSGFSDENDKTVLQSNKNSVLLANDTLTIEDTIVAGDLTVLSQRIDDMKEDSVCIVSSAEPEEPVLLTVVQKLAHLPIGSIDCSALTPLLRDQFPELLETFPMLSNNPANGTFLGRRTGDFLTSVPGSWVKLPEAVGLSERIYACAEVEQAIFVPLTNISANWLLVSIESITLIHATGRKLTGVRKNDEWAVLDFVTLSIKETLVPPNNQQSLRVLFTPKIPTKLDLRITLNLKSLLKQGVQSRNFLIRVDCINPLNNLNIIPKECINFGTIADQCFDSRVVQVNFDGVCTLPLTVYVKEKESRTRHFILKPCGNKEEVGWSEEKFHHVFHRGEKQILEFRVFFEPNILLNNEKKSVDFTGSLIFKIGTETESDGILKKMPMKGSVAFAKFLCSPSCTPLVFRAHEKGQPVSRAYPVKNVGCLPIAFALKIVDGDTQKEQEDGLFTAPKSFYLSANEESAINITFNANTTQHFTKRFLIIQMQPNGRDKYDVELIGVLTPSGNTALSQASGDTTSTKSIAAEVNAKPSTSIKLLTTAQSLSWTAMPLEKEARQSLQLKNASTGHVSVRLSFKENSDSFKLVNEDGEKVKKIRKVLKGDCPYTVTVAFNPDLVGPHHNALFIQINSSTRKKMIKLNGIGGMPNIYMGNVKSDLNGCKILTLQNSSSDNQFYFTSLVFKNEGRTPGFILIKPSMEVLSLSHELTITPSRCVVAPNSKVVVKVSQRLKSGDLKLLLSGKDISKLATLSVTMGDEMSRLRMRMLLEKGVIASSERLKILTVAYQEEKEINLKLFEDGPGLENQFLKSLKTIEVAVVVERSTGICEPTILEDADETLDKFVTVISAPDNTVTPTGHSPSRSNSTDCNATLFFSESMTSHSKITKWLETLESPVET